MKCAPCFFRKKFLFFFFMLFFAAMQCYAENSFATLLAGYLSQNLELKTVIFDYKSKVLDFSSAKIENGISFSLSTGSVTFSPEENSSSITFSPSASLKIPGANNSCFSVTMPFTLKNSDLTLEKGSAVFSVDLFSGKKQQTEITLKKSEREVLKLKRKIRTASLDAEKQFLKTLQQLFNDALSIHTKNNDLYEDSLELKVLETQGYSKTSAKYMQAYMKVQSDMREIEENQRSFIRETALFAKHCNISLKENATFQEALNFLPKDFSFEEPLDIQQFNRESYSKIEEAYWEQQLGKMERLADKNITVSAEAEYKFNSASTKQDDAGGKINLEWGGLSFGSGIYFPTGTSLLPSSGSSSSSKKTYMEFSLSLDPSQWLLQNNKNKQKELTSSKEEINLLSSQNDYETTVLEKITLASDIKWSKKSYEEELQLYSTLENDMKNWFSEGLVTKSDWQDALNKKNKAQIQILTNALDSLIFNNEIKSLFIDDSAENKGVF